MPQAIYLGSSDFVDMRRRLAYYVDKTYLVGQVLHSKAKVMLMPRPRRFGKTLNLSMLRAFFSEQADPNMFTGLIVSTSAETMSHLGQYPTVFLTFKDIRNTNWDECFGQIKTIIGDLFLEHRSVWQRAELVGIERHQTEAILDGTAPIHVYQNALNLLTKLLQRVTGKQVILLIDEYDSPIHEGHLCGYKQEIVGFMRQFLGAALKDNSNLEKALLTGILRVAKDSIFSGLNNLKVYGVLEEPFSDGFGFTETEVHQLLVDQGLLEHELEVKQWYNGYVFGVQTIYNPWSIMSMAADRKLEASWIKTSENKLIRDLVTQGKTITSNDLEILLQDRPFVRDIQTGVALDELTPDSVWSLLLFSGYLTIRERVSAGRYDLRIPNLEVRMFFEQTVRAWMGERVIQGLTPLLEALLTESMDLFELRLTALVRDTLSYHDTADDIDERVYHVFLLGILTSLNDRFVVLSNQEAGYGRFDLALVPRNNAQTGFIFELKRAKEAELQQAAQNALEQIQARHYTAGLNQYGTSRILSLGLAFCGKKVAVAYRYAPVSAAESQALALADIEPKIQLASHRLIRCRCSHCQGRPDGQSFDYEVLTRLKKRGNPTIQCYKSGELISINQLLLGTFDEGSSNE